MLLFKASSEGAKNCGVGLAHAHAIGADGLPLSARPVVEGDVVRLDVDEPAALCAMADAGDRGVLALRTTLLRPSDAHRSLTVELARRATMLVLCKLEDWVACDAAADHPVIVEYTEARDTLVEALAIGERATGDAWARREALACEALRLGISAGERLALWAADRLLAQRGAGGAQLGCSIEPSSMGAPGVDRAAQRFDYLRCPMRWPTIETREGEWDFGATDRWLEWAIRTIRKPVVAGPLIDLRPGRAPGWLEASRHSYQSLRESVFEHVRATVARYQRFVPRWNVASGLHLNEGGALTLEQVMDLTRVCVTATRREAPRAEIMVEIAEPFGGVYARNSASLPPSLYAEMLAQQGVSIDTIALRIEAGAPASGCATRDMLSVSDLLDRYAQFDKPIEVSSLGAPSEAVGAGEGLAPGRWRREWSDAAQAEWLTAAAAVALSKPFVRGVCWQALVDPASPEGEMSSGGLLRRTGGEKPAMERLRKLRSCLRDRKPPSALLARMEPDGR